MLYENTAVNVCKRALCIKKEIYEKQKSLDHFNHESNKYIYFIFIKSDIF